MFLFYNILKSILAAGLFAGCTGQGSPPGEPEALSPPAVSEAPAGQVAWRSWAGRDSARTLGRPVFLFLYTRRSYWCREMVERCFEDRELAREIVRGTFPIRVDADRRPDLAERFGMGGWPSVVFTMPEGDVLTGSTYMDPVDLVQLLRRVRVFFDNPKRREDLERERGYLKARIAREDRRRMRLAPTPDLLHRLVDSTRTAIARGENPGCEALTMLLEYGRLKGDVGAEEAALAGLDRLGRMRDRDGAFFLASLTPDAAVVDREKNLAVNAGLLGVFAKAAKQTGKRALKEIAVGLGEALREGFYVPQDSLFLAGWAGFDERVVSGEARAVLPGEGAAPRRDPAFYAGWNALAVSAFLDLHRAVGDDRYLRVGRRVLASLRQRLLRPEGGVRHSPDADAPLLLEDQALVARAALDLFEVEGRDEDLRFARDLADLMVARFADASGALRDRTPEPDRAVTPAFDRLLPSGNGIAAQVLLRLHTHTAHAPYRETAGGILTALVGPHIDRAAHLGALARGLVLYLHPSTLSVGSL